MVENIKISINILPFGEMKLVEKMELAISPKEEIEEKEMPIYVVPHSINVERVGILYEESGGYRVPETTDWR